MFYLPTGSEMQQADYDTINRLNIPALTLMEKAGEVCVQAMLAEKIDLTTVLILVGNGNNGGDGLVIARLLLEAGYQVSILWQGRKEKLSAEAKVNYDRLQKYAVPFYEEFPLKSFSLIIDTLFGVGLNRPIAGKYHQIIEAANKVKAIKLAIDIPSGISSETGLLLGIAFKADYTIAIQNKKLGHLLEDGRYYCGKIITKEIGISNEILKSNKQVVLGYEKKDYQQLLPLRDINSNKGSFGKLLIIAGSKGMAGAAILNALGAYRSGAGLIKIYTHEDNRVILQNQVFEGIVSTYSDYQEKEIRKLLEWSDTVLIGSGLGLSSLSKAILYQVVREAKGPCIIDGDGLTLLANSNQLKEQLKKGNFVLTPHIKEMSRILNTNIEKIKKDRKDLLSSFAQTYQVVCALKDARTIIGGPGKNSILNTSGNEAMAKAGSGDVLAGIIAGLIVQKMTPFKACVLGTYLHGRAGDLKKIEMGSYSVMARDLVDGICQVFKELEE